MYRKDLIELFRGRPRSVAEVAELLEVRPREVEDDLRHLLRSVRRAGYRIEIIPARCRQCDFSFHADKLGKPGKCPRCRQTWIAPPRIRIEPPAP